MAKDGQLGHGDDCTDKHRMTPIDSMHFSGNTVLAIAAGRSHCIALGSGNDRSHSLWTWGCNSHGQLGHSDLVSRSVLTRMKNAPRSASVYEEADSDSSDSSYYSDDSAQTDVVLPDDRQWCLGAVSGIDAGAMTTAVLFVDGALAVCGDGRGSALGLGNLRNKSRLTRVGRDGCFGYAGVRAMAVGFDHMIAVTCDNRVHS